MAKKRESLPKPPPTLEEIVFAWRKDCESRPPLPPPTRLFCVGEEVVYGGFRNIHVVDVIDGGMGYLLHYYYIDDQSQVKHKFGYTCSDWLNVFAVNGGNTAFARKEDIRITFSNNDISSLLHKVYRFGVDFDPPYQRGLVWSVDQKVSLLDSIFSNIEIGKFTFNQCEWGTKPPAKLFEIIDGKQRLTALCEFYEGRLEYRGKFYHQLSRSDRNHFENFPIIQGEMRQATEQQILKLFVKLNTTGVPMDAKHLEMVKKMIATSPEPD